MPNSRDTNERIKQNQRLRPTARLIAVSERLREYQATYGRSALWALGILVAGVAAGLGPVAERRLEAWKGVMSDRKITPKERGANR